MVDYDWTEIRTKAIKQLGEMPRGQLEEDLIEAFKAEPLRVSQAIDAVIAERNAGANFTSAWAIIRHRVHQAPEHVTATDNAERTLRIKQAEAWIRNAGVYIERENELLDELFGDLGPLRTWQDQGLEDRMAALWHEHRPRGEHAETECERRALERVELRSKLAAAREAHTPQLDPEYDDDPNWHHTPEPELENA